MDNQDQELMCQNEEQERKFDGSEYLNIKPSDKICNDENITIEGGSK